MTITLITGANKGLGYESARRLTAEGHTVYLGARDLEKGQSAAAQLGARPVQIDVTDDASIQAAMAEIDEREGRLDVLVNNAGIWDNLDGADELTATMAFDQFDTNATGVVRTTQAALALLRRSNNPVVVNVSSGLGSFAMVTDPCLPPVRRPLDRLLRDQGRRRHADRQVRPGGTRHQVQRNRPRLPVHRPARQLLRAGPGDRRRGRRAYGDHRPRRAHRHLPEPGWRTRLVS